MWKKVALVLSGMLIGCASAVAINTVSAQNFPPNPQAQRWEQFCEILPLNSTNLEAISQNVQSYGAQGFELVNVETTNRVVICFKRPAQ